MIVARLPRHILISQPARCLKIEHKNLSLQQRRLHPLSDPDALSFVQRKQRSLGCEYTRTQVGDGDTDPHRSAVLLASNRHQAAHTLRYLVKAGTIRERAVLTKAGNRHINQTWIDGLQ